MSNNWNYMWLFSTEVNEWEICTRKNCLLNKNNEGVRLLLEVKINEALPVLKTTMVSLSATKQTNCKNLSTVLWRMSPGCLPSLIIIPQSISKKQMVEYGRVWLSITSNASPMCERRAISRIRKPFNHILERENAWESCSLSIIQDSGVGRRMPAVLKYTKKAWWRDNGLCNGMMRNMKLGWNRHKKRILPALVNKHRHSGCHWAQTDRLPCSL